jgi:hypothetical protein
LGGDELTGRPRRFCGAADIDMRTIRGSTMSVRAFPACVSLALLLAACSLNLRLEIMNAGDTDIDVALGSDSQQVAPGLWFDGDWTKHSNDTITVSDGSCRYRYLLPDLDQEPWHSLIGKSVEFRWFSGGRLVAYPPTPDVGIRNNPQRASTDATRTIRPLEAACR